MVLAKRYLDDGKSLLRLSPAQLEMAIQVKAKLESGEYATELNPCPVCGACSDAEFEPIADKDRYGLPVKTAICRKCGLVQARPYMSAEACGKFYSLEYKKLYIGKPVATDEHFDEQRRRGGEIFKFVLERLGGERLKRSKIAEIGCSAGGILKPFHDFGCEVVGVDLSEEYASYGAKVWKLPLRHGGIDLLAGEGASFDIVIYSHVLEHISDIASELRKTKQILAPKGSLFVEVPGLASISGSYGGDILAYLQNAHVWNFTNRSLINLLNANGFKATASDNSIKLLAEVEEGGVGKPAFENDYEDAMALLKKLELLRIPRKLLSKFPLNIAVRIIRKARRALK